uniref:Uncharacterized protein n=2 Tax=Palpitomonas bilix TaxID=652834 RepID=A0A7S3G1D3_9EUKA|mmetsp:Transcript_10580/g.27710  ORF Transcript_10580/g.27710 Transcript_10580/m.27710 type:complete len:415 (+) Transcript_10580:76-1320(+)|eukprot:CAMPEP_0113911352 /NCGR_PEP_ID=MMETSP0780_2-20120614/28151_1 /TAXON_ID=652834 /ORGANISM="Palpitomonas bilix" /LENGTH=414 /DNA_ID=CAMNT_0000907845 /DNA_START=76 /DNA_END=1320 /DNA_ORIENTATION=- /assembly_acc=CAM_ASM_000599
MSKEVLISQRQGAQPAGGGGGAGPSNAAPVSNYKGVMLCDRPGPKPMGATGGGGGMAGGEPVPFLSSVVPKEQLGLNPSRETRDMRYSHQGAAGRSRDKHKFLRRHKQWLSEFKKLRDEANDEHDAAMKEKEEKRRKFAEYSSKLRKAIRRAEEDPEGVEEELKRKDELRKKKQEEKAKSKAASKPAWARTEKDEELAEEAEVDDLLDFAKSLDYNQIIEDVEVRQALKSVRNRIQNLESTSYVNDDEESSADDEALEGDDWKEKFASEWERLNGGGGERRAEETTTSDRPRSTKSSAGRSRPESSSRANAPQVNGANEPVDQERALLESSRRALQSSSALRKIHSSRSIRNILEKSAAERQRQDGTTVIATLPPVDEGEEMLVNYIHHDEDNHRVKKTVDPSNLPYLHRNPAV